MRRRAGGRIPHTPTRLDGFTFGSKAEARRYAELRLMEQAGQIKVLGVHPAIVLKVNEMIVGTYVGDFSYVKAGAVVIEDVKSPPSRTPLYKLKKKLVKAIRGIEIVEIEA